MSIRQSACCIESRSALPCSFTTGPVQVFSQSSSYLSANASMDWSFRNVRLLALSLVTCRMMPQSPNETSVIAFTVGAASLAVLLWIQDLRSKAGRNITNSQNPWPSAGSAAGVAHTSPPSSVQPSSTASPSGPSSPPPEAVPDRVFLLLLKGKHGRSESPPAAIEEACSALLVAAGIPHALVQTVQVTCSLQHGAGENAYDDPLLPALKLMRTLTLQGVRVEVEVGGLQSWQESKELDAILALLSSAGNRKLSTEVLLSEEQATEARCTNAFGAVRVSCSELKPTA